MGQYRTTSKKLDTKPGIIGEGSLVTVHPGTASEFVVLIAKIINPSEATGTIVYPTDNVGKLTNLNFNNQVELFHGTIQLES